MTVGRPLAAALVGAALCAPHAGRAQAPAAAAPAPRTHTTIELGFVSASGNTTLRTLNAAEQFVFQPAPWKFTQTFAIVNGYTNGSETANNIRFGVRADYAFTEHFRAYGLGLYERNRFAGIARRFEEQLGLSYGALVGPRQVLDLEAGAGRNQQTSPTARPNDYWLGRAAAHYRFTFRPNAYLDEKVELLQSLQSGPERRINSEAALVAPLSTRIALRFGYVVRFVNAPPVAVPAIKQTDQIVSSGVQIAF
jgi:putative salt-induced outer membrane protein